MTHCPICGALTEERIAPSFIEVIGGIKVDIRNAVHVRACTNGECGEEESYIPDMSGLMRLVALSRVLLPVRLGGAEIRMLRRALEMTQPQFAELLETTKETVSRWENDAQGMGDFAEKSIRLAVAALLKDEQPTLRYNPAELARMKVRSLPTDVELPPLVVERVRIRRDKDSIDAWDNAAVA